ncbi:sugar phosphate isomerase [Actinobacteria bacterium YIM 96077]|uniref:Sugar phosphate isomerase n=1 Tax=Phytoactinopolyspora halophila TaxID=1981511 RepID=A0A329QKS5_9ACTN|nr:EboA domain-containing protein [Phytoactinopolyspora halophila]AYY14773.1 sugar phosphate isomerase [Actinobacteria bacterium YIM 96077]RAW13047.1 sugar phosphate isomerase [Phytoactinopolyspora halophila]
MSTVTERFAPDLDAAARERLDELVREVRAAPSIISTRFPAAARQVARGVADPADPDGVCGPRLEDQVRIVLLAAAAEASTDPDLLRQEIGALYRFGDADEKRAVLRALSVLDTGPELLPLVDDALRTNDIRLIAAALDGYGARHLPADAWRQGVLKCLFVGVPLAAVSMLDERADAELARMVADFCHERSVAGRTPPPDAWKVLDRFPDIAAATPSRG